MTTPLDQSLAHVVGLLKQDFPAWFSQDPALKRAFLPNDRPSVLDATNAHETIVLVRRPRLTDSGVLRTFVGVADFCAVQEPNAVRDAMTFFNRLEAKGPREPKATLSPQVTSLDEEKFYRVNVMFTIKMRHAEGA